MESIYGIITIISVVIIIHLLIFLLKDRRYAKAYNIHRDPETIALKDLKYTPLVNFLVPAWKEGELFKRCLESIKNLTYPKVRAIVNAGGNKRTIEIANSFKKYDNFIILHQKGGSERPSLGKVKAINQCIDHIKDGLVYFIDADTYINDEILLRMIYPITNLNENVIAGGARPLETQQSNDFINYLQFDRNSDFKYKFSRYQKRKIMSGQTSVVNYDVIKEIKFFSEDKKYATDKSMGEDIFSKGFKTYRNVDYNHRIFVDYSSSLKEFIRQKMIWTENFLIYSFQKRKVNILKFLILFFISAYLVIFPIFLLARLALFIIGIACLLYIYLKKIRKLIFFNSTINQSGLVKYKFIFLIKLIFYIYIEFLVNIIIPFHFFYFLKKINNKKDKKWKNRKIYYFAPRGLSAHLHFYKGWVLEARKFDLPIYLFTTVSIKDFLNLPPKYKGNEFIMLPSIKFLDRAIIFLFFLYQILRNKMVIVQVRKRGTFIFEKLKIIFPRRFKYIIESEGDIESEFQYLETHPYKKKFYSNILKNQNYILERYKSSLKKADHILCVTENLKDLYISRDSIDKAKISTLTTGCDSNKFYFNPSLRMQMREKLGLKTAFVMIYVGSVYFSWQKISRTLEIYNLIKKIENSIKFIIITRESDKDILNNFLKKHNIIQDELIIRYSVPNEKIPNYLNAADLGIILRDNHPMNNVAAPGKFGEYLCCGLPVITGIGIANFSEMLVKTDYGIVLNDIYDDNEVLSKLKTFINNYLAINRRDLSNWAINFFSYKVYVQKYVAIMKWLLTH
ncbi:MAG: glycosyltransferase [Promethearchaeota archaeon]